MLRKEVYFQANSSRKEALALHTPAKNYSENIDIQQSHTVLIFLHVPHVVKVFTVKYTDKEKTGKDVPVHAMETHTGSGGIAPLIHNLGIRWR
jgi:hypothetical protein